MPEPNRFADEGEDVNDDWFTVIKPGKDEEEEADDEADDAED